ncbi:MAG: hypothetical protein R2744_08365 [Bacteroidales bacterium]
MLAWDGWDPETPLEMNMGTTIGGRLHVYSYVGQEMHQLYGFGLKKAPEGSYYLDDGGNQGRLFRAGNLNQPPGFLPRTDLPDVFLES